MGAASKGSTIGGIVGGVAGSVIPGVGTAIGAGIGKGIGGLIGGGIDKKKADAMMPASENPEQRALQRRQARLNRAYKTGTADKGVRTSLGQMAKTGLANTMKYGGGASGVNAMNRMYSQALLGINEQGQKAAAEGAKAEGEMINTLAQRRLEVGMEGYDKAQAEAAQATTDARRNLGSSIARAGGMDDLLRKKKKLSTDGSKPSVVGDNGKEVSQDGLKSVFSTVSGLMNKPI